MKLIMYIAGFATALILLFSNRDVLNFFLTKFQPGWIEVTK